MPHCIVFGFTGSEGKIENLPDPLPTTLRGIPPRRQYQYMIKGSGGSRVGRVRPIDAKDAEFEDLLFLSTDLFASEDEARRQIASDGELFAVYEACANAVIYEIELSAPSAAATRSMTAKKRTAKRKPAKKTPAKKAAKKASKKGPAGKATAKKGAAVKKSAASALKRPRRKKSKKTPMPSGRGGIPRKKSTD